jgi:hypothetical protein
VVPGTVLRNAWALYAANWQQLIPTALVVNVLITALVVAFAYVSWVAAVLMGFVGTFWLEGTLVRAVADLRGGRHDLSIRTTVEAALPRINVLSASGLLASLGIAGGLFLLVVPGLVLLTFWSMIIPAIMLENAGVFRSFSRSRELVRGNGWNVFAVIVLTFAVLIGAEVVLSLALLPVTSWVVANVLNIVASSIIAPFAAAAWTLTYYELRGADVSAVA